MVKKDKTTNNNIYIITQKTKDWAKRTQLKAGWKNITDYNSIPTKTMKFLYSSSQIKGLPSLF